MNNFQNHTNIDVFMGHGIAYYYTKTIITKTCENNRYNTMGRTLYQMRRIFKNSNRKLVPDAYNIRLYYMNLVRAHIM
jgi:hypothetical protein